MSKNHDEFQKMLAMINAGKVTAKELAMLKILSGVDEEQSSEIMSLIDSLDEKKDTK